jgi:hypothetical protein
LSNVLPRVTTVRGSAMMAFNNRVGRGVVVMQIWV